MIQLTKIDFKSRRAGFRRFGAESFFTVSYSCLPISEDKMKVLKASQVTFEGNFVAGKKKRATFISHRVGSLESIFSKLSWWRQSSV